MLLSAQKLSRHDLERALEVQRSMGGKLGRLLVSLGLVAEADVFAALARQADLPLLRADAFRAGCDPAVQVDGVDADANADAWDGDAPAESWGAISPELAYIRDSLLEIMANLHDPEAQ